MPDKRDTVLGAVAALAGRRIDAQDAKDERFPLRNVSLVRRRLREQLSGEGVVTLVCSAACGADLIALEVAEELGLRRRIILPFAADRFLATSVTDRPGEWEAAFDRLTKAAERSGDLVVLAHDIAADESAAYAAANERIVLEAAKQAQDGLVPLRKIGFVVWEGEPRGEDDATASFRSLTAKADFELREVCTAEDGR